MITNIDELDSSTRYEKLESSTVGKKEPSQPRTLLERWKAQNPNVRHILYLVFFAGLSESMGFGPTLSSYLYISTGRSNLTVGYLDSAMGISKLLTALPMGDIADRYGRSPVSKVGSFAYTFATVITVFAIFARASNHIDDDAADDKYIIVLWAVALSIWGFGKGVVDGPVLALFADSVPAGERSNYYYYLFVVFWVGALAGPAVALLMFVFQSNEWTFAELASVIFVALGFKMLSAYLLCFLKDSAALETVVHEADSSGGGTATESALVAGASGPLECINDEGESESGSFDDAQAKAAFESVLASKEGAKLLADSEARRRTDLIPPLIFAASLASQLGAGMTVKFYPLYFMNDCGMSPAEVQAIYFCVPLAMLACGSLSTRLAASGFGRVQTIILCKGLGVASLLVFIFVQRFRDVGPYLKPLILVPPFLLATALTDATYPLEESTLMDFVPVERRGRWKSLESVSNFGWCGSAVLGGYLVDRFDYSFTFFITALIQGGAVLIWLALVPLVPKSEAPLARGVKRDPADSNGLNRAHSKGYYTDNRTRTLSGFRSQSVEFRLPSTSR